MLLGNKWLYKKSFNLFLNERIRAAKTIDNLWPKKTLCQQPRPHSNCPFIKYSNRKVEADLRELFLKFGDLLSVHVKRNERHNKLYAFILYKEPEQAAEAL